MSNASSKPAAGSTATAKKAKISAAALPEQYKAVNWGPWWSVLMIAGSFLGGQTAAVVLITTLPNVLQMTRAEANVWLDSTGGQFLFVLFAEVLALVFLWLFLRDRNAANLKAVGITRSWKPSDIGLALVATGAYFVLLAIATAVITTIFTGQNFDQQQETGFDSVTTRPALFMTFVGLVILPPIVEEVLFRGVLFGGLRRKFSFWWAAVLTSIVFAIPHLAESKEGGVLWLAGVDTLILSFFLCFLREKTGSLWASIFLHMAKNSLAFVYLFVLR